MILEMPMAARWFLVIFMYVFCFALAVVVVAILLQRMRYVQRMSDKAQRRLIFFLAAVIYIGFIFLMLNDWAVSYLS